MMINEEAKSRIMTLLEIGGSDGFNDKEREALVLAIKALEDKGYEQGYEQGYADGYASGLEDYDD